VHPIQGDELRALRRLQREQPPSPYVYCSVKVEPVSEFELRPYVTALTINRLAERDIATIIDRVAGNKGLPANIRQDISAGTNRYSGNTRSKSASMLARSSSSFRSFKAGSCAALFAEMLSLPNDGRYPALELTPEQRRQRTLEALSLQIEALTRSSPLLMIFEDAHWTDPTSLEAFGRTLDRIKSLRVLLIVTYRPEFEPPWIGRHRRHSPVRRGDDEGGAGGGERGGY
jgi:hypothetical protein